MSRHARIMLLLVGLAMGVGTSPAVQPPGFDRELFRYIGMVIAQGGVPYRDAFDIKPPLIFFAALGGSRWLAWAVILGATILAAQVSAKTWRRLGIPGATVWASMWLVFGHAPALVEGGGLASELSAAWVMLALAAGLGSTPRPLYVGACTTMVLMTQQNDVLALLPMVLFTLRTRAAIARFVQGSALVALPLALYFAYHQTLSLAVQNTFVYPLTHYIVHSQSISTRWQRLVSAAQQTALLGWAVSIAALVLIAGRGPHARRLTAVAAGAALQCMSAVLTPKTFPHYFLALVPYLVWCTACTWTHLRGLGRIGAWVVGLIALTDNITLLQLDERGWLNQARRAYAAGASPYEQVVATKRALVADARGQPGQIFIFRLYDDWLAIYADLQVRAPTPWVHTLFWGMPGGAAEDAAQLEAIIAAVSAQHTRYILDFSAHAPLPTAAMQHRWEAFLAQHYVRGVPLACGQLPACGWLYTRTGA